MLRFKLSDGSLLTLEVALNGAAPVVSIVQHPSSGAPRALDIPLKDVRELAEKIGALIKMFRAG